MILAHEDAISRWRKLMGPTKVYKTQHEEPNCIRGMFGLSDTRNCTHGSGMFKISLPNELSTLTYFFLLCF